MVIETAPRFPIRIGRGKAYACRDEVCKFESGEDEGCVEYSDSLGGTEDVCVARQIGRMTRERVAAQGSSAVEGFNLKNSFSETLVFAKVFDLNFSMLPEHSYKQSTKG